MNLDLSNIIKLLPEFYKALGETFIMVGISSVFGIVAGGLLGVWLFVSGERQLFANAAANPRNGQPALPQHQDTLATPNNLRHPLKGSATAPDAPAGWGS